MSRFAATYLDTVAGLLSRIRDEEADNLDRAAALLADAVVDGRRIFAFGCTHSALPVQDLVYRAGGLMLINPLLGPGITALDHRPVTMSSDMEKLEGFAKVLLDHSEIGAGDVLIVVSVSGRNAVPIEIAQLAQQRDIKVIGVTSLAYTGAVDSRHQSGKKMYDFADVVLDNKVEHGDAVLEDERSPQRFCPASGVTSTALLQAMVAATIELLLDQDVTPPVFLAANVDGGAEYNARLLEANRDRIFFLT